MDLDFRFRFERVQQIFGNYKQKIAEMESAIKENCKNKIVLLEEQNYQLDGIKLEIENAFQVFEDDVDPKSLYQKYLSYYEFVDFEQMEIKIDGKYEESVENGQILLKIFKDQQFKRIVLVDFMMDCYYDFRLFDLIRQIKERNDSIELGYKIYMKYEQKQINNEYHEQMKQLMEKK